MIWAYNEKIPKDKEALPYHSFRGTKTVYLKEFRQTPFPDGNDPATSYFDILAPNVSFCDILLEENEII